MFICSFENNIILYYKGVFNNIYKKMYTNNKTKYTEAPIKKSNLKCN